MSFAAFMCCERKILCKKKNIVQKWRKGCWTRDGSEISMEDYLCKL
jgi:hypothetical protein